MKKASSHGKRCSTSPDPPGRALQTEALEDALDEDGALTPAGRRMVSRHAPLRFILYMCKVSPGVRRDPGYRLKRVVAPIAHAAQLQGHLLVLASSGPVR